MSVSSLTASTRLAIRHEILPIDSSNEHNIPGINISATYTQYIRNLIRALDVMFAIPFVFHVIFAIPFVFHVNILSIPFVLQTLYCQSHLRFTLYFQSHL